MHPTDWLAVCVEILHFAGLLFALGCVLAFRSALCQAVCLYSPGEGRALQGPAATLTQAVSVLEAASLQ